MISILVEARENHSRNTAVLDLLSSFGQMYFEDSVGLKIKKSRRKHFKEFVRLKKLGVLGKGNNAGSESRNRNVRKMSERRINDLIILPSERSKQVIKRNSYNNLANLRLNSLIYANFPSQLSLSIDKLSVKKNSLADHSNEDQGTCRDSPLVQSFIQEHQDEAHTDEEDKKDKE